MRYISTRGQDLSLNFSEVIMKGLAKDGGLYLPEEFPKLSYESIKKLQGKSYQYIAKFILWKFIKGDIEKSIFDLIIDKSYDKFYHKDICPIKKIKENEYILELFYGPTLAFKDISMQFISKVIEHYLDLYKKNITIIGATSGDTGSSAIEAFANKKRCKVFILFPYSGISYIQKKQMTYRKIDNIYVIAIKGNFDDCQKIIKQIFIDKLIQKKLLITSINSINWARIIAQIVYYFSSATAVGAPDKKVIFSVPTGNFGNILAGYIAFRMGLPIKRLIIATNENDILHRTLNTGIYKINNIIRTNSPSMDIQVSSNFERLMFEINNRNSNQIRKIMHDLEYNKMFTLDNDQIKNISSLFSSGRTSISETENIIKDIYEKNNYLVDPHTAVGINVGRQYKSKNIPLISLSTAHPSKFPEVIKKSCRKNIQLPYWANSILKSKKEYFYIFDNNVQQIKDFILKKTIYEI